MNTVRIAAVVTALASFACGGAPPPGSTTETLDSSRVAQPHAEGRHAAAESNMPAAGEPAMAPEIKRFHDSLAPRWHAEHGPKRMADTCGAIGELHSRATDIVDAAPPAGADPRTWAKTGKDLEQAVFELSTKCKANDATAFEVAFDKVHDSFHRVMEAGGGEHAGHGEAPGDPPSADH